MGKRVNCLIIGCDKMRKEISFIFAILILSSCGFKVVKLAKPIGSRYMGAQTEPSIAIDPNNNKHIVAGAILDEFYESFDGGKTWLSENISSVYGVYGDPVLIFDTASQIYFFIWPAIKKQHISTVLYVKQNVLRLSLTVAIVTCFQWEHFLREMVQRYKTSNGLLSIQKRMKYV